MSNASPITSMVNPRRHDLLLPLSAAILLHLAIAVTLLWFTAHSQLSPPRPLEVRLVEVEALRLQEPVALPSPGPPHTKPVMRRARPLATTQITLHTHAPITEPTPPAPPSTATETAPDAPTVSSIKPDAPIQIPTEEMEGTISSPRYDVAYLSNPAPAYPPLAKRLRIEGRALIRVLVDSSGKPEQVEMAQSSGAKVLDDAALNSVKQWLFVPAQQGNRSVAAWVEVPIRFHLE
jgi:protein TonB